MKVSLLASTICICFAVFTSVCQAGCSIHACAPEVAPQTIRAIIHVESAGNPLAIHVESKDDVSFPKPKNRKEAIQIANQLITAGYSVDCGLMQVNSRHLSACITVKKLFDPCENVRIGAKILAKDYARAATVYRPGQRALLTALSAYNTGNFVSGFYNGYVEKYFPESKTNQFLFTVSQNPFGARTQVDLSGKDTSAHVPDGENTSVNLNAGSTQPEVKNAKDNKGGGAVVLKRTPSPYAAPTAVHLSFPKKGKSDVSKNNK